MNQSTNIWHIYDHLYCTISLDITLWFLVHHLKFRVISIPKKVAKVTGDQALKRERKNAYSSCYSGCNHRRWQSLLMPFLACSLTRKYCLFSCLSITIIRIYLWNKHWIFTPKKWPFPLVSFYAINQWLLPSNGILSILDCFPLTLVPSSSHTIQKTRKLIVSVFWHSCWTLFCGTLLAQDLHLFSSP